MKNLRRITNRNDFIEYCYRQLGSPVIEINVAYVQAEDRVDEAIKMFYDYHVDGSERSYIVHSITQEDLDNGYLTVPEDVLVVTGLISSKGVGGTTSPSGGSFNLTNNLQMKAYFSDMISGFSSYGLSSYVLTKTYIQTFNTMLSANGMDIIEHNFYGKKLYIYFEWDNLKVGDVVGYECWIANDVDEIYNDYWLKQYATALIKKQWGQNLIKVDGMTLPGGGVLKGSEIYQNAIQEISDLEEKLKDDYSYPVLPFMA